MGTVLPQAVPRRRGHRSDPLTHDREHRGRVGEDRRLRVMGAGQLLLGPFPHDAGQRDPERLVDGAEGVARGRKSLGEILPHADALRALARTHQDRYHRTTALPQVKPAPNATSSTSDPGPTRPSATAWSSARGMDAEDVFP